MKKAIVLFVVILAALAFTTSQKDKFSKETLSKKLTTPEKTEITFQDILKKHNGHVTVIEVWASWCSDCVKAMPTVKDMQSSYKNVDFVFISMDKDFEKWQAGIAKHELKGDHYWVADGMKGELGKSIDLDWIPRYIVIDGKGNVNIYKATEKDFDKIHDALKTLQ